MPDASCYEFRWVLISARRRLISRRPVPFICGLNASEV